MSSNSASASSLTNEEQREIDTYFKLYEEEERNDADFMQRRQTLNSFGPFDNSRREAYQTNFFERLSKLRPIREERRKRIQELEERYPTQIELRRKQLAEAALERMRKFTRENEYFVDEDENFLEATRQARIQRRAANMQRIQQRRQARVTSIPIEQGPELTITKNTLGANAISQEDFENGETVEVLYSEAQAKQKRERGNVNVKPSMVFKSSSVDAIVKSGNLQNPITRQPIALRERRTLRFLSGGKRKTRKQRKSKTKHRRRH